MFKGSDGINFKTIMPTVHKKKKFKTHALRFRFEFMINGYAIILHTYMHAHPCKKGEEKLVTFTQALKQYFPTRIQGISTLRNYTTNTNHFLNTTT